MKLLKLPFKYEKEFEALVKLYMKRAYYTALGILGSHDEAMEASQEAFLRVYKNFSKFEKDKNFFTWYYKILRNVCLNMIRDRKNKKEESIFQPAFETLTSGDEAEVFEHNEEIKMVEQSLFELDNEEREILILREFDDMSYKEIAEILGIPEGTVMSRLYYARKHLNSKLKKITA